MSQHEGGTNKRKLGPSYPLKMYEDTEIMIEALAAKRGESKAEVMRRLLHRAAAEELLLEFGADTLLALIRKAMTETQKPLEDRLAALNAKTAIAAATAMYTNVEVLGQLGRRDIKEIHEEARVKAVAFVKSRSDKTAMGDESNG